MLCSTFAVKPTVTSNLKAEGIVLDQNLLFDIILDKKAHTSLRAFEGGYVYYPELLNSSEESGYYLIMTCICGIADDAEWKPIYVEHTSMIVNWSFQRNGDHCYAFDKKNYLREIKKCHDFVRSSQLPLAIENVVFPE